MNQFTLLENLAIWSLPVLFAITAHEAAHGWVAKHLGDPTADLQGRVTLNPLKHIDWLGTVLVPILLFLSTHFLFGWAKPVPVNETRLRHPRRDAVWVALAGPLANLIMLLLWAGWAKAASSLPVSGYSLGLYYMGIAGILINLSLFIFNLLPIPPLDGSHVIKSLLPDKMAKRYQRLGPYGLFILLILLFTQTLGLILIPLYTWLYQTVLDVFHITNPL